MRRVPLTRFGWVLVVLFVVCVVALIAGWDTLAIASGIPVALGAVLAFGGSATMASTRIPEGRATHYMREPPDDPRDYD